MIDSLPVKPELLAPGGSFPAAHAALRAGADGVYLGLKEFSARKAAANFTPGQLRRLKGLAAAEGKRIYVALNTVVRDAELERAADALWLADLLSVDGVIVQDLGVLALCRRHFPRLAVHASTQMAVHDESGVRFLGELGVRRVILSRELPIARIAEIRRAVPDVELEVFLHGALCYSWSGYCLASWALTGRSGNRGECAQICRSLFRADGPPPRDGHFFSCGDLCLDRDVAALARIGVDALKIEGRMKSPEYVHAVVSMYRALLDRGDGVGEEELEGLRDRVRLTFARPFTRGFSASPRGDALIRADYPGHRGASLGGVLSASEGRVTVRLRGDLSLRDGVGYFPTGAPGDPVIFSVQSIRRGGREVPFARRGETVRILLPDPAAGPAPVVGQELRQMSSRFLDLSQPKEGGFPPFRTGLEAAVGLEAHAVPGRGTLRFRVAADRWAGSGAPAEPFLHQEEVSVDRASRPRSFPAVLADLLREAGDSGFAASLRDWKNGTPLPDDGLFVPPSELKRAKNGFYEAWERHVETARERCVAAAADSPDPPGAAADAAAWSRRAGRRDLVAGRSPDGWPAAFFQWPAGAQDVEEGFRRLHEADGWTFLPLAPVHRDEAAYRDGVRRLLESHPEARFAVGLNAASHIAFARELAPLGNVAFFCDFLLYAANRHAVRFLRDAVPSLLFAYHWIEDDEEGRSRLRAEAAVPMVTVAEGFRPPLFLSLGCPVRHAGLGGEAVPADGASRCPPTCPRSYGFPMSQGRNRFLAVVRDCVTTLFREERGDG